MRWVAMMFPDFVLFQHQCESPVLLLICRFYFITRIEKKILRKCLRFGLNETKTKFPYDVTTVTRKLLTQARVRLQTVNSK